MSRNRNRRVTSDPREQIAATRDSNVFVMMRYRDNDRCRAIETAIRTTLRRYGLTARFAKEAMIEDDVWGNIVFYMRHSRYGLVVFEEIDERQFNPNISMELGFMYALGTKCLVLKDKRMPTLPTDVCGKIYKDFDTYAVPASLKARIAEWCEHDLGMQRSMRADTASRQRIQLLYDSDADDDPLSSWTYYVTRLTAAESIRLCKRQDDGRVAFHLQAFGTEPVGINKSLRALKGRITFEYQVTAPDVNAGNVFFSIIPMQETGPGRRGLIEVGTEIEDHPDNARSTHRVRYHVPADHINTGQWYEAEMSFDFTSLPTAFYSIFGPRLNEGCDDPGKGIMLVGRCRAYSFT